MTGVRSTGAAAAWLIAGLLAGCTDGYPSEDLPDLTPSQMNQAQRLAALNHLGRQPHLAQRWRYELLPSCRLEVRAGRDDLRIVALEGSSPDSRYDDIRAQHEVRLRPPRPPAGQAGGGSDTGTAAAPDTSTVVLQSAKWTDSVQAHTLLTHLAHGCGAPTPGPAAAG